MNRDDDSQPSKRGMIESVVDLKPMSTGDLLDRTARTYRAYLLPMLTILLLPFLAMFPFEAFLARRYGPWVRTQVGLNPLAVPAFTIFLVISNCVYAIGGAALIRFLAERYLGPGSGPWSAYRRTLGSALTISWVYFLESLLWCGPAALLSAVGLTRAIYGGPWWWYYLSLIGVHLLIIVIGASLGIIRLSLAPLVVVIERASWLRALQRSWNLMRYNTWRATAMFIFAFAASLAVSFALSIPARIVEAWRPGTFSGVWGAALGQIAWWASYPFSTIAFVLLYFDILVRREAFDLEVMANNLGASDSTSNPLP